MIEEQPEKGSIVRIALTGEQQTYIRQQTGFHSADWAWPHAQFVAMSLLAQRIGYTGVPHGRTATQSMLSGRFQLGELLELTLTPEQQSELRRWAGRDLSAICFYPDDYVIRYHEDWETSAPAPQRVGQRFLVVGETEPAETGEALLLRLASGSGTRNETFGTGKHPATRLALELLETIPLSGSRALDIGTGSGILAVGAVLLGAASVDAYDIDPNAVEVARETADRNGMSGQISVYQGEWQAGDVQYQLAIGNLFPNILIDLAPALATSVVPGGFCLTSGVVGARARAVEEAFEIAGFAKVTEKMESNWTAMLFSRKKA